MGVWLQMEKKVLNVKDAIDFEGTKGQRIIVVHYYFPNFHSTIINEKRRV